MFQSLKRRVSRSFQKAGEILTGSGPAPEKQFRNALLEGDEEKAISLYLVPQEGGENDPKALLCYTLSPGTPFHSKKNDLRETPLMLAVRCAATKLVRVLLERGGDPAQLNARKETALHLLCSQENLAAERAALLDLLLAWDVVVVLTAPAEPPGASQKTNEPREKVSIHCVDVDGNAAIHNAAAHGLQACVESLISRGAIISLVNRDNATCCELADQRGHTALAHMLEIALVFQPEDLDLSGFADIMPFVDYASLSGGALYVDCVSLDNEGLERFAQRVKEKVALALCVEEMKEHSELFLPRAETLLNNYNWDVERLLRDLERDRDAVLSAAKMQPVLSAPQYALAPTALDEAVHVETAEKESEKKDEKEKEKEENTDDVLDVGDIVFEDSPLTNTESSPSLSLSQSLSEEVVGECEICGESMLRELPLSVCLSLYLSPSHTDTLACRAVSCLSGHAYCVSCWRQHLAVQVCEHSAGALSCCGYKCGDALDAQYASVLLTEHTAGDVAQRFAAQRLRLVADCAGFAHCPRAGCTHVVATTNTNTTRHGNADSADETSSSNVSGNGNNNNSFLPSSVTCVCGHCFCAACRETAHSPCTCVEIAQWRALVRDELGHANIAPPPLDALTQQEDAAASLTQDEEREKPAAEKTERETDMEKEKSGMDDIANALWIASNTKRCPRCRAAIEKDEGCNHMTCRHCRHEFCWICMSSWSSHSDNTGGYFQCNRFVESGSNVGTPGRGVGGDQDDWSEERGNAHAETIRMRERNRQMTRFIHHFTRFHAHSESVALETRMSRETVHRIQRGLTLTQADELCWLQRERVTPPWLTETAVLSQNSTSHAETERQPTMAQFCVQKNSEQLLFLTQGFEELLKCRHLLQWSYPHAFYAFHDNALAAMSIRQQRRAQAHRTVFEAIQAELEAAVETLSDILARRRLRAGRTQITQATCVAKQRRVELETVLVRYVTERARDSQTPSRTQTPSQSQTPRSQNSRSRSSVHRSSLRRTPLREADDTQELVSQLLLELDHAPSDLSRAAIQARLAALMLHSQAAIDTLDAHSLRRTDRDRDRERERRERGRRHRERDTERTPADEEEEPLGGPLETVRAERETQRDRESDEDDDAMTLLRLVSLSHNDEDVAAPLRRRARERDRQRVEEETELNRAILLSLQFNNAQQSPEREGERGAPALPRDGSEGEGESESEEQKVQTLVNMGFERELCMRVLRESANNVELAANELLGLDL